MKCQIMFSGKSKKNISKMSSAGNFTQSAMLEVLCIKTGSQ